MGAVGVVTRGTTNPHRLRRVDRWIAAALGPALAAADDPLVVDLGYGRSPVTTVELAARLRAVRADVEVVGVEIDPERVRAASTFAGPRLSFVHGGFELGPLHGRRPVVVRALNVLRQYDEASVAAAWDELRRALAPGGALVEGTSDELGRLATWVRVGADGARSLTLSARLASLDRPGRFAERLPKALIHHNVPGQPIHALLVELDEAWARTAPVAVFGARQHWVATVQALAERRAVLDGTARWRLGELTVPWEGVAPRGPDASD